ncbi:MAG: hypothetical protein K0R84_881 [Clostridia bacterium]|jgi:predicted small lipoprotein YifL|nr:hypothetical protein [Clostridia bacterium]
MKRIISIALILITLVSLLGGCGTKGAEAVTPKDKEVVSQMNTMRENNNKPKEMYEYLNQNITELSKQGATEALGILVSTLEDYESIYNERLFTGNLPDLMYQYFDITFDYNKIEAIKEQELKDLLYDIIWGGFKIINAEGSFVVVLDYNSLKTFSKNVEDEIKAYIEIMAVRYNNPASVDASLVMTPDELENLILQMENYILSYNNQHREEIMISMYEGYIMVYLSGTEARPVFDFDTGAVDTELYKNFEDTAAEKKDTIFGRVISRYVELLKKEGFTNTEKVQDFILNIDTVVIEELERANNK